MKILQKIFITIAHSASIIILTALIVFAVDISLNSGDTLTSSVWNELATRVINNTTKNTAQDTAVTSNTNTNNTQQGTINRLNGDFRTRVENSINGYQTRITNLENNSSGILTERSNIALNSNVWQNWSISGLTIGKPLIIANQGDYGTSGAHFYMRVTDGVNFGKSENDTLYFGLQNSSSESWASAPSTILIPTKTTVTIRVRAYGGANAVRILAYQ